MQSKSKILILSSAYLPYIGGSELAIKNITDRLPDFEFDLITARLDKNTPEYEKLGNVSVFRVGFGYKLDKFLLPILGFFKALKLHDARVIHGHHVVHAYQASYGAGAGWLLKYFYPHTRTRIFGFFRHWRKFSFGVGVCPKLSFIVTLQEGKNLEEQGFLINFFRKLIIKKADRATAISRYLKNYMLKIKNDLPVEVIPNGVDIENFSRQYSYGEMTELEKKLDIMPDDKVVISVSRLVHKNGLDLLVKALAALKNKNAGASYKLILAGDGPQKEHLVSSIKYHGLENNIIFVGSVSHEDLPLYLKISDVFVRPSRSEGLGSAFLEAMAAEIPIIGTKVGGIPDFLEDRKTGLFCTMEPDDIAFKIRIILENDKLGQEMVNNAAALVRERYDWEVIADKFRELYLNLKSVSNQN